MNNEIFVSYVVPCYDIEHYLPRCIKSLECQEIAGYNVEFILVNDGSKDGTLAIINEFAKRDERVVVINQLNQGVCNARNNGLKVARGKYVFFLDGDDFLTADASQVIFDLCVLNKPDILITNAYTVSEDVIEKKKEWETCVNLDPGLYKTENFVKSVNALPISFKTYRRDFLINNSIFYDEDLKVGEVYTFFIHALIFANTVFFSKRKVMNYLYRKGSVMRDFCLERDGLILRTIARISSYAQGFKYDITILRSYNVSYYKIVAKFAMMKYARQPYSNQLGSFINDIVREDDFKKVLQFFIFKEPGLNRYTLNSVVFYFFSTKFAMQVMRLEKKVYKLIKSL